MPWNAWSTRIQLATGLSLSELLLCVIWPAAAPAGPWYQTGSETVTTPSRSGTRSSASRCDPTSSAGSDLPEIPSQSIDRWCAARTRTRNPRIKSAVMIDSTDPTGSRKSNCSRPVPDSSGPLSRRSTRVRPHPRHPSTLGAPITLTDIAVRQTSINGDRPRNTSLLLGARQPDVFVA